MVRRWPFTLMTARRTHSDSPDDSDVFGRGTMKEQIQTLVELQKIETETIDLKNHLEGVSERLNKLDRQVADSEAAIAADTEALETLKSRYRTLEEENKDNTAVMVKSRNRLNNVKNVREHQALQKSLEDLKAKGSELENEMIECLDEIERLEKRLSEKQAAYDTLKTSVKGERSEVETEAATKEQALADLRAQWDAIARRVDSSLLDKFLMIKDKKGVGIVPVTDAICYGCHMNIPPQIYNELQRFDSLRFCPHCQRMIYWEKSEE